ncbi:hypothetical protein QIS99_31830 [Streptomyces sp. B-S-A8]|uniref:HEAT repeat domain-containing protein n=1 Tax=Streptomyces solicavernae TaxID=3043614 RepID=A0ABT6S248_9ACTN|nr:hypothetical protein [Streptomyces sp. B-S-A8]MDI3390749.1 hypothetical protein [Streptomyces sp. B-S-A8]
MPDPIDSLVQGLSARDRATREAAANALVGLGAEAVVHVLPVVREGESAGLDDAEPVLQRLGAEAERQLRSIRRRGPGPLRRKALVALAELSGGEGLDGADQSSLERLVRVKFLDESSVRLPAEAGRWLAFPADRFDDAVSVLGLHDLRPCTTVMGVAAATKGTDSLELPHAQDSDLSAYRVFITPELKSRRRTLPIRTWRLLWGNSFLDEMSGFTLADKLSRECGEAHFYSIDPYNDAENWYVARDGYLVRSYGTYADPQFSGDPLPFEVTYREGPADGDEDAEESEGCPSANRAASNLSVQSGFIPMARTQGHGWLASTHPDVPTSRFPGALPV